MMMMRKWKPCPDAPKLLLYSVLSPASPKSFRVRVDLVPLQLSFEGGECAKKNDAEQAAAAIALEHLEKEQAELDAASPAAAAAVPAPKKKKSTTPSETPADVNENFKSRLNVLVMQKWKPPVFDENVLRATHEQIGSEPVRFRASVELVLATMTFTSAEHPTKREAEQDAAQQAVLYLQQSAPTPVDIPDTAAAASALKALGDLPLSEAPPRTDGKSWISAFQELFTKCHGPSNGVRMWENQTELISEQKFRARVIVLKKGGDDAGAVAADDHQCMPWSGKCVCFCVCVYVCV